MPRPLVLDTDPNVGRVSWEIVVTAVPGVKVTPAATTALTAAITTRAGVAPLSVTVDPGPTSTVTAVMPDDRPALEWLSWVGVELAAAGIPGTVTAQNRVRVTIP
jgi:hypothetical protein